MSIQSQTPKDLEWKQKENTFVVTWKNGSITAFPLHFLRKECPCAGCGDTRRIEDPFKLLPTDPHLISTAKNIEPVGHYAVRISWADGHSTGIYSFDILHEMSKKLNS
jgi:DUF971 family protein